VGSLSNRGSDFDATSLVNKYSQAQRVCLGACWQSNQQQIFMLSFLKVGRKGFVVDKQLTLSKEEDSE
jgi:hypothetical protein